MSRIKMPTFSIRFDEQQLFDLATKAKVSSCKKGYLQKSDPKLKKLTQRWCCIYQNLLFYFESESVPKPIGVVLLEGCVCTPVEDIGQPISEGAFCISSSNGDGCNGKIHFFIAQSSKERNDWIEMLSNANMARLHQELEELKVRCGEFSHALSTKNSEVQHLKQANILAQQDIQHLRGVVNELNSSSSRQRCSITPSISDSPDDMDQHARVLQGYIKGWLIRRSWKRTVRDYVNSPLSEVTKKRNQLIWKFVASEEDYNSQLTVLAEHYKSHFQMAAVSRKPPINLEQSNILFRNCDELLILHRLFLRGLHMCIDKWPVILFGDILKHFIPLFSIYHKYVGDHSHAAKVLLSLLADDQSKDFVDCLETRPFSRRMYLDSLLNIPLKRISIYIKDLQDLCAHTPMDHVDYIPISNAISEFEGIQKIITEEAPLDESVRQLLKMEAIFEGGCKVLLDKEQTLIKKGSLQLVRVEGKTSPTLSRAGGNKLRSQQRSCFLFSRHLILTIRTNKKTRDCYKILKILPLVRCHVSECRHLENPELIYRAIKVNCDYGNELETLILLATTINEKAEWIADITHCVENEKQNKILQSQSIGEPAELSSRFIRYSTFKTGKEQLVNIGKLECLLERLVKISYFGLDFLNSFLMSFPLYTDSHTVFDYIEKNYRESLQFREKRRGSISPMDAVRDARVFQFQSQSFPITLPTKQFGKNLSVPNKGKSETGTEISHKFSSDYRGARASLRDSSDVSSVAGVLFALKHWICKHFFHFREDALLSDKLERLLDHATHHAQLTVNERNAVLEVTNMYRMQKEAHEEIGPVIQLKLAKGPIHLPQKPFECLLLWTPREAAEQLCLIEGALFQRIGNDEILRYFSVKGHEKAKAAPHLSAIFEHFNRMSLFFMWSLPTQRYFVDRSKILEFLIQVAWECYQLHNFSSVMQLTSALEHGSISRFKSSWEDIPKNLKLQFRQLTQLTSTDSRFKELRNAMKMAPPPTVPYLGILLSEMSGIVEGMPTYLEESLINFSKMRKCVRLITNALQHQKDPYEFNFIPEICRVLLHTAIPGNEDDLYKYVDEIEDK